VGKRTQGKQAETSVPGLTNIKEPFTTTHNNQNSPYI